MSQQRALAIAVKFSVSANEMRDDDMGMAVECRDQASSGSAAGPNGIHGGLLDPFVVAADGLAVLPEHVELAVGLRTRRDVARVGIPRD
jgi:hypothetical protein